MTDLHWWSATDLAAAIRGREISASEALEHFVARIEALDGPINSVVHWDLERARNAARAADASVAGGDHLGPLHGVPISIKDSFQTEGCITTSGSPDLAEHVPTHDAWPVARLRQAGAIPFAKTNLPIFAGDIQSFNDVYGTTNNPHDITRTPGGSSGGSSAALAMGFTPIELGSDIGGSIRVPAHYSGVMGHKPSYGIVPAHGQIPGMPGTLSQADLAVCGPMARCVDDLELELDVLAGPDRWNHPAWRLDLPAPPRTRTLRATDRGMARRRRLPRRCIDAPRAGRCRGGDRVARRHRRHHGPAKFHIGEGRHGLQASADGGPVGRVLLRRDRAARRRRGSVADRWLPYAVRPCAIASGWRTTSAGSRSASGGASSSSGTT